MERQLFGSFSAAFGRPFFSAAFLPGSSAASGVADVTTIRDLLGRAPSVEGTMWSYLPQRLMIEFPPIDDDLAHISDREFAGDPCDVSAWPRRDR